MVYVAQLFICARLGFHRKLLKYFSIFWKKKLYHPHSEYIFTLCFDSTVGSFPLTGQDASNQMCSGWRRVSPPF